ncbi:MAG: phage tail protein [Elusimicrobia bacterium]|nr:phage tail protein [Elusimicrobiota bacterium]
MAKIPRKALTVFGKDGGAPYFEQFGSFAAGGSVQTKDVEAIQALAAWRNGWQSAVQLPNKAPLMEDMNALLFVLSHQIANILQDGIVEWNSLTSYYKGSVVRRTGTFELYGSVADDNIGNAPPAGASNAYWTWLNPVIVPQPTIPAGTILPFAGDAAPMGFLLCDGGVDNDSAHHDLYLAIGTSWGNGTGAAGSFNRPDLRGVTLRGVNDMGSGDAADAFADPDKATRVARHAGATGNNVGSYQEGQNEAHTHTTGVVANAGAGAGPYPGNLCVSGDTGSAGGYEARMNNAAVLYIIKT